MLTSRDKDLCIKIKIQLLCRAKRGKLTSQRNFFFVDSIIFVEPFYHQINHGLNTEPNTVTNLTESLSASW